MSCVHFQPKTADGGFCAIDAKGFDIHGGRKMVGAKICARCPQYDGPVRGWGDVVAKIATPIARLVGADCIDPATKALKPESECQKKRVRLNGTKSAPKDPAHG